MPSTFSAPSASTAIAATSAESMPPLSPISAFAKAALAHIVARAQHQRIPSPRRSPLPSAPPAPLAWSRSLSVSNTTRSSANAAACAITSPLRIDRKRARHRRSGCRSRPPGSPSPPPPHAAAPARRASRAARPACHARTARRKYSGSVALPAKRLRQHAPLLHQLFDRVDGYSRRGQKPLSFHASSQIVIATGLDP